MQQSDTAGQLLPRGEETQNINWKITIKKQPGPEVIKLFSCSAQLSTKFQLNIKTEIPTNGEVSCVESLRCDIYHAYKC